MFFGLRADYVGQNPSLTVTMALDHGGSGFIAGRLNTKNKISRLHRRTITRIVIRGLKRFKAAFASVMAQKFSVALPGRKAQSQLFCLETTGSRGS
jgi:hypothetical protein